MPRESKHNYCPRKRKLIIGQRTRNNNYLHIFRYTRNIWSRNRLTKSLILWWINSSMTLDIPTKILHKQIDVAITQLNYLFFTPALKFSFYLFAFDLAKRPKPGKGYPIILKLYHSNSFQLSCPFFASKTWFRLYSIIRRHSIFNLSFNGSIKR